MKSYWNKVGPNPMTGVLIRRGKFGPRPTGRMPCDNGGRDWSDVSTSQGMPRTASRQQKLEQARKDPPPELSERTWICRHLDFKLLVLQTERINFCYLSHPVVVFC